MSETTQTLTPMNVPAAETAQGGIGASATSATAPDERPFETALTAALEAAKISDARTIVANTEAILMGHKASTNEAGALVSPPQLAAAKARIAIATGDGAAAQAILVKAIETHPKTTALRALMTEVMLAQGRATDVRPVLKHLHNGTTTQHTTPADAAQTGPSRRDTSV